MMTTKGKIIDVKLGFLEPGFELKIKWGSVVLK